MATDTFNAFYLILQLLMWGAMLATFGVYFCQLQQMRASTRGQNILSVVQFLQAPEVRAARTVVRQQLRCKNYAEWSADEKRAADMVCSTYDVVAVLIFQEKLVPSELFLRNWGPSIRDCYKILSPHIEEMQKPEMSGIDYWDDFGQLYMVAAQRTKS